MGIFCRFSVDKRWRIFHTRRRWTRTGNAVESLKFVLTIFPLEEKGAETMKREEARKLARELVSQMTLEEKSSQLRYDAPAIPRLGIPAYNWWSEALHGVARAGTATMFPQCIGLGAMFDAPMMKEIGEVISTEARAKYNMQASRGDRDI